MAIINVRNVAAEYSGNIAKNKLSLPCEKPGYTITEKP